MKAIILLAILGMAGLSMAMDSLQREPVRLIPEVRVRSFFMATQNEGALADDFAWASALRIAVQSTPYKGFSIKAGYRAFGIHAHSDVWAPESTTGQINRYETGLFDQLNPEQRYFGKVEELHLAYAGSTVQGTIGRMFINTPFINPQDGRLNPTAVEGVRAGLRLSPSVKLDSWAIWRIGPRSTGGWYHVGQTFGLYPTGRGTDGAPSRYPGHVRSDGVAIVHLEWAISPTSKVEFWDTYVDNISNTVLGELSGTWGRHPSRKWKYGLQMAMQQGVVEGGSSDETLRYKDPQDKNYVLGGRWGLDFGKNKASLNFTRIWGEGRFLSPREWGRDPFYTFLPRERNEGYAHVQAVTATYESTLSEGRWTPGIGAGVYYLPHPSDAADNKYGFPSYSQVNLSLKYKGTGTLKDLDALLLVVRKDALDKDITQLGWIYNKVNLTHVNLIVNYHFW
jgi:hypothetical protein